ATLIPATPRSTSSVGRIRPSERGAGTRGRFTDALRQEALAVLEARKAQGASQEGVAEERG
ncbi:hypothetical protein, partial [Myxococcus sp. CA056]|uniref:hypothetical protein n=1 Tax=Myxococcus sp. CA056 TaxID=2741740 RepID=UPI001C2CF4E4